MPSDAPKITVYTTEEKRTKLRLISAAMGKSANKLINELIDDFLSKYGDAIQVDQQKLPEDRANSS